MGIDVFESAVHPDGEYGAVFERDEDTAYFYLLDMKQREQKIVSALPVPEIVSLDADILVSVHWSKFGKIAGLFVQDELAAVFDLETAPLSIERCGRLAVSGDDRWFGGSHQLS